MLSLQSEKSQAGWLNKNMNFAADIGNSFSKLGLFEGSKLEKVISGLTTDELVKTLNDFGTGRVIVASVKIAPEQLIDRLVPTLKPMEVHYSLNLPVTVKYHTPETLGVDRLAAVSGAHSLSPGNNCLVIDIGTCITYDYLDAEGNYWGGAISPGLGLKVRALYDYTAKLPLVDLDFQTDLLGKSTEESISSGIVNGTIGEIEFMIQHFRQKVGSELDIYLCGGDAKQFESKLKAPIFVVPELVLMGLNQILLCNEKV